MTRRLSDYSEFLSALRQTFVESYEFSSEPDLTEILREPRLIIASNHATPLSWLPAMTTLAHEVEKAGGGDRHPRAIFDRWFYSHPFMALAVGYLSQYEKPLGFDELLADFSKSEKTDLVVFPEGANTFFGDVSEIQDFRSSRFVELAILAHAPILIVAHAGSEGWSFPLKVPPEWISYVLPFSKFFGEKLMKTESVNLPILPKKIQRFRMKCELYRPTQTEAGLSADSDTRRSQIREEAEKVRQRMQTLLKSL